MSGVNGRKKFKTIFYEGIHILRPDNLKLNIGSVVTLQVQSDLSKTLAMNVLGMSPSRSVLVAPCVDVVRQKLHLIEGDKFIAHFQWQDTKYAFETQVNIAQNEPFEYYHLAFPDRISGVMCRKVIRKKPPRGHYDFSLAMHEAGTSFTASLTELSLQGAVVISPLKLGKVKDSFSIELSPSQSDKNITLPSIIGYIKHDGDFYHHGLYFHKLNVRADEFIVNYLEDRANQSRKNGKPKLAIVK